MDEGDCLDGDHDGDGDGDGDGDVDGNGDGDTFLTPRKRSIYPSLTKVPNSWKWHLELMRIIAKNY